MPAGHPSHHAIAVGGEPDEVLRRAPGRGPAPRHRAAVSGGAGGGGAWAGSGRGDPPILVLDEPSAGLDPLHVIEIRTVLGDYAAERAVLVSTHSLGESRRLCARVLVLSQGRLVYDGSTAGMAAGDGLEGAFRRAGGPEPADVVEAAP